MLNGIPSEQLRAAIDECVRELLAEVDVTHPPVDALVVARRLGLVVARAGPSAERARFVRISQPTGVGRGTVLLADEPRPERRQWAVAHEVGEHTAHRVLRLLGVPTGELGATPRETLANRLAGAMLLPTAWLAEDGAREQWDLLALKRIYTTASHELIARRMLEMAPPVIVSLYDQGRLQWRRSNFLPHPPPLTALESATWQSAWETGAATHSRGEEMPEGIADVHCWAVHEPGWKREILRTALHAW